MFLLSSQITLMLGTVVSSPRVLGLLPLVKLTVPIIF